MEKQKQELSMEDITVMKLMEEIIEFDQEIKMKQNWINSRMKLLHEIQKKHKNENKQVIYEFLQKIQPDYPSKLQVEYKRPGSAAIPMPMADAYKEPIALKMGSKNPTIALKTKDEVMAEEIKH